jgi:hypothetical protein
LHPNALFVTRSKGLVAYRFETRKQTLKATQVPSSEFPRDVRPAATLRSGRWLLKRALIGIVLITLFAGGGAALLYATIEPDQPTAAAE